MGLGVLPLVALSCHGPKLSAKLASGDEVELVRAVKGHELIVQKQGEQAKVRLVGIYTFEALGQEGSDLSTFGRLAVQTVQDRAKGAALRIVLERAEPDSRGRYLAFAELGGSDLGRLLVEQGQAAVYTEYPFSREADYLAVESRARDASQGLWGARGSRRRVSALRETWGAVRTREHGGAVVDPLLRAAP